MTPSRIVVGAGVAAALSAVVAVPALTASTGAEPSLPEAAVTVEDDDNGSAMFNSPVLKPGDRVQRCIMVTYTRSLTPVALSLYGTVADTGLDPYLDLAIEVGSGGAFGDCSDFTPAATVFSGTLASFAAAHTNSTDGIRQGPFTGSPQSRSYRFTVTLQDDHAAQGKTASAAFTWETQDQ